MSVSPRIACMSGVLLMTPHQVRSRQTSASPGTRSRKVRAPKDAKVGVELMSEPSGRMRVGTTTMEPRAVWFTNMLEVLLPCPARARDRRL